MSETVFAFRADGVVRIIRKRLTGRASDSVPEGS
jgi:hypothetical protein